MFIEYMIFFSSFVLLHFITYFQIGHYYGTPRPPKEALVTTNGQHQYLSLNSNNNFLRRSNSANEMFQQQRTNDNGIDNNGMKKFIHSIVKSSLFFFL